jgi:pilus assembly protein CpaE
MALRNVMLLTDDSTTINAVKIALESNGQLSSKDIFGSVGELTARLKSLTAPAVLIDIDGQPKQMFAALEPLARQFGDTKFIVLAGEMRSEWVLDAMQAGARHFLLKNAIVADLSGVLHRLCPEGHGGSIRGAAVTVLSAGGGCGATTVAVNLAAELELAERKEKSTPVLLLDLDAYYGSVATYLGVDSDYGIVDLLNRTGPIDAELIRSTAIAQSDHMHALLSTSRHRMGEGVRFDPPRLGMALDSCKRLYRWTVVDAPRLPMTAAVELAKRSTVTILLMQLTVKDIRVARRMWTDLIQGGAPSSSLMIIANRYRKRGLMISLEAARKALGMSDGEQLRTLVNNFHAVTEAVNFGKPLTEAAPRSDFRKDLQELAKTVTAFRDASVVSHSLVGGAN